MTLCRGSSYKINHKNSYRSGKGLLSRSEPLCFHPNPSFNSIGRAGREARKIYAPKKYKKLGESLVLGLFEVIFNFIYKNLNTGSDEYVKFFFQDCLKAFFYFLSEISLYKLAIANKVTLKTGIKFGGQYLGYSWQNNIKFHEHSKTLIHHVGKNTELANCYICKKRIFSGDEETQTSVRLSNHVSKASLNRLQILLGANLLSDSRIIFVNNDISIKRSNL
jgi:tRNA splicing endonuclease